MQQTEAKVGRNPGVEHVWSGFLPEGDEAGHGHAGGARRVHAVKKSSLYA
jgi:hypothetical protein